MTPWQRASASSRVCEPCDCGGGDGPGSRSAVGVATAVAAVVGGCRGEGVELLWSRGIDFRY